MATYAIVRIATPKKVPPGESRWSTSTIQPTFQSSGFQRGTGPPRMGSTVPKAIATTA